MRSSAFVLAVFTMMYGGVGCAPPPDQIDGEETIEVPVGDEKNDSVSAVSVKAGAAVNVQFSATGDPLESPSTARRRQPRTRSA